MSIRSVSAALAGLCLLTAGISIAGISYTDVQQCGGFADLQTSHEQAEH